MDAGVLTLIGACVVQSDKPSSSLPAVRVDIGMTLDQLKAGSTYPFASVPSVQLAGDFQVFQITTPYNFVLVDDNVELKMDNLGGNGS